VADLDRSKVVDPVKINDTVCGLLVLFLALALWLGARNLPNPANQVYGPAAFPNLVALLLGLSSLPLLWTGLQSHPAVPLFELAGWTRQPRRVLRFVLVPAAGIIFVLAVETVGFIVLTWLLMAALLLASNVAPIRAAVIALAMTLFVHTVFYVLLEVQLPWGLLDPVRW
jgi:putative tricarboxylic transport membrane protein